MRTLHIDIETYSSVNLLDTGVYRYVEAPDFQILMAAWSVDRGPVSVAVGEEAVRGIPGLWDPDVEKIAHNAAFERVCFSRFAGLPTGEYLPPEEWTDTMAIAAEHGYPQGLEALARALGGEQKDTAGKALINLFCLPNRKGQRILPEDRPEDWGAFVEYCSQDVETLISVHDLLGDFPTDAERELWVADQRVNDEGMRVDLEMAQAAVTAAEDNRMVSELEVMSLTGVDNPGSRDQLLAWLRSSGLELRDLRAETVESTLAREDLTPAQRRVLEIRQDLALSASKKYTAALTSVCSDGRLRGGFRFFGAHTGRWAGRGVQPHNLPRAALGSDAETEAAILDLRMGQGADDYTLKALVRPMFTGPFTVVDYSAIEARVLAWLAGESWALEAFQSGRDIYVETAERMGPGMTRTEGKVAVLALGYNGGVGSLEAMGAEGSQAQLQLLVDQWREANPAIVRLWKQMGDAFWRGGPVGELLEIDVDGPDRFMRLPSGRSICYRGCRWEWGTKVFQGRDGKPFEKRIRQASYINPKGHPPRLPTYGGRLVENATQAVARDILAHGLLRLHHAGARVVGHVHDEVIVQGAYPGSVEDVQELICDQPSWAGGLPIDGAGFTSYRYRKD